MKLPNFLRPVIGSLVSAVVTTAASVVVAKIPELGQYIHPTVVAATATTWVILHLFKQGVNVKVNPTNASSPSLANTVPATVVNKDKGI